MPPSLGFRANSTAFYHSQKNRVKILDSLFATVQSFVSHGLGVGTVKCNVALFIELGLVAAGADPAVATSRVLPPAQPWRDHCPENESHNLRVIWMLPP